jgi:hypothetical protein
MKREYIIFKVYADCPLLRGWLRLGNDKGIFQLVDSKESADFCFSYKPAIDTEESARLMYEIIRKSIIEFVYELLFIDAQTLDDYYWIESQVFFGQFPSSEMSDRMFNEKIELLDQQLT